MAGSGSSRRRTLQGGRTLHHCLLILANGAIAATARGRRFDGSWLDAPSMDAARQAHSCWPLPTRGSCRSEAQGTALTVTRRFPETEPYLDAANALLPAPGGLYVVGERAIRFLRIA